MRPEGKTLSSTNAVDNADSTETPETVPGPETAPSEEHSPEESGHEHQHAPSMNPECIRELVIDVPEKEVSKAFKTVVNNYRKYTRVPGFRPGKVPETYIRKKFAAEIRKDVMESLLPEQFNRKIAEMNVKAVGQPQVAELTVEEGQPLHAKAVFEIIPEFSIEGYQSVTVPKPSIEISEEDYQHELEHLRESRAIVETIEEDRPLKDGDWAQVSYKGGIEGESEETAIQDSEALFEVGGEDTIEAFTNALRGAKVGQELKAEVTYPADFNNARLAGKTVAYAIEVKAIKKRTVPELNDAFAKELGNFESLAKMQETLREELSVRKRSSVEGETKEQLMTALADRFTFPVPEALVQEQIDARLDRGLRVLAAQGMTAEQMRKMDFGRLRAAQRDSAIVETKTAILLDRIAQEENIVISDDELSRELQIAAIQNREPLEALRARLSKEGGMASIREHLRREKTAELLYERLPA